MNSTESIFYWLTTFLLAGTFFLILLSLIFNKSKPFLIGRLFIALAFTTITVFGVIRWIRTDHPPFVTLFESMITSIWFVLLTFQVIQIKFKKSAIIILPVSAITFLLMGWSSSLSADASPLSVTLTNVWLFIHASFATAGAASFLIASSFAVLYLLGKEKLTSMKHIEKYVPEYKSLMQTILNFQLFGIILWGVMIVSGAIWAHSAWGRYWAWDPIELWSLISWLLYSLLYHSRLAIKIPPRTFSWLTITAVLFIAFSLWGVHYIYDTIHSYG
jgi:ABC-type transport system involved in cytochrome c biogenesis permease subunit